MIRISSSESDIQFERFIDLSDVLKCCSQLTDDKMVSSVIMRSFSAINFADSAIDGALSYLVSKQFIHCSIARGYQMMIPPPIAVVKKLTAEGNVNSFLFSVRSQQFNSVVETCAK